jgi:hypothetical protein
MAIGSADGDQLEVERERLPSERVIQVELDGVFANLGNPGDPILAGRDLDLHLVADLGLDVRWELGGRDIHEQLFLELAIRFGGVETDFAAVAHRQPFHCLLEAGNDLPGAEGELERVAAARAVEYLTAVELADVVNGDGLTLFRCLSHGSSR